MVFDIDRFKKVLVNGVSDDDDVYIFKCYRDLCKKLPQYTPTKQENDIIATLTGLHGQFIKDSDIKELCPGVVSIRTSKETWYCLMGREYLIDFNEQASYLICLN